MSATPRVELLHEPGCPLTGRVRATVDACLAETGIVAPVRDREGRFASPTLLIDGVDVVTGAPARIQSACRLDLPTRDHILRALRAYPR